MITDDPKMEDPKILDCWDFWDCWDSEVRASNIKSINHIKHEEHHYILHTTIGVCSKVASYLCQRQEDR